MKRTGIKRKSKTTDAKLKEQLWQLCRKITEQRYHNYCYTCGKPVEGSNRQLGHFIPSSVGGIALRYNLDNLRWQCYYCNINLGGNGSEFYPRMVQEVGQANVDELFKLKNTTTKGGTSYILSLISEYKLIASTPPKKKSKA